MAIPLGTNAFNSLTRRYIAPQITDSFYRSNVLFYRLYASGKKHIRGGTQIEQPILYSRFDSATWYDGFDVLNTTPQDPIKNAAYDWRHLAVTVSIDGPTLRKNDSPESVASILRTYFEAARMEMEDQVGIGLYSDAVTNGKLIDGLQGAVDNGTVAATYAGLTNRTTTNGFWQPLAGGLDTATTVLTLAAMRTVFGAVTDGARHPTLLIGTQGNYNRFWNLLQTQQRFGTQPMGSDEQLAKAGFSNLLFDNVPFAVDSHVNTVRTGTTGDHLYFLNEEFMEVDVHPDADMKVEDFLVPINQDVIVAKMLLDIQLVLSNVRLQGLMTGITA